jgi:hypothetical protein
MQEGEFIEVFLEPEAGLYDRLLVRISRMLRAMQSPSLLVPEHSCPKVKDLDIAIRMGVD